MNEFDTNEARLIPVYIVNPPTHHERLAGVMEQFEQLQGFEPRVAVGVLGTSLPDVVCADLASSQDWARLKGTIGCFLSHVSVWEKIARLDDAFAIVIEDDVNIANLGAIHTMSIPADMDIVFINHRMSTDPYASGDPQVVPITAALRKLDHDRSGAGTDGYLLSPGAARKLLTAVKTDRYFGHIDGRLLRYATSSEELSTFAVSDWIHIIITQHHQLERLPKLGLLKGYALSKPLVIHLGLPSVRDLVDGA